MLLGQFWRHTSWSNNWSALINSQLFLDVKKNAQTHDHTCEEYRAARPANPRLRTKKHLRPMPVPAWLEDLKKQATFQNHALILTLSAKGLPVRNTTAQGKLISQQILAVARLSKFMVFRWKGRSLHRDSKGAWAGENHCRKTKHSICCWKHGRCSWTWGYFCKTCWI